VNVWSGFRGNGISASHKLGHLPLKGGGRERSERVGVNGSACDPHPDPPPFRGRERTECAARFTGTRFSV